MNPQSAAAAAVAAGLISVFSIVVSSSKCPEESVRCALVVAGVASTVSFGVVDLDPRAVKSGLCAGITMVAYQGCLAVAFKAHPAAVQAIVNCNVLFTILYTHGGAAPPDVLLCGLCMAVCAGYVAWRS